MKSAAPTNFTADRQHSAQARLTPGSDRRVTPRFRLDFRTVMSANSPMIEQAVLSLPIIVQSCTPTLIDRFFNGSKIYV
jgi:hypothetical protein